MRQRTSFTCIAVVLGWLAVPVSAPAARPLGIDISHWEGSFNWTNAKNANVEFAWCKATQDTNFTDSYFTTNEKNAKNAGILIGAFHFADYDTNQGTNGANAEANYFWQVAKAYIKADGHRLMPMLDLEGIVISGVTHYPGEYGYTKSTFSQWANAFCTTLSNNAAAAGITIKPVIYTSSSFAGTWLNSTVTKWPLWVADWNGENKQTGGPSDGTGPWSNWVCWQYGSMSISGEGSVDGDVFNGTSATLTTTLVIGANAPVITNQPDTQTVPVGTNVTFSAGASGATPLSYQWKLNGGSITGATASTYTRSNVQVAYSGTYSVTVTNAYGSVNSANAVLTVYGLPPVVTACPTNVTVPAGSSATFYVAASGTAPLSYQWRRNSANVSGASATSLTVPNVSVLNAGTYTVLVANAYGMTISSNALLTLALPSPIVLTDPFTTGQVFRVTVTGAAGSNCVIAASTNLTDWVPLQTNVSPFVLADTNAANLRSRYYRARLAP